MAITPQKDLKREAIKLASRSRMDMADTMLPRSINTAFLFINGVLFIYSQTDGFQSVQGSKYKTVLDAAAAISLFALFLG